MWAAAPPERVQSTPGYDVTPAAWDNGDHLHLAVDGMEIVMPAEKWELVCIEVRRVIEHRLPAPAPLSVTGKNAEHLHTLVDASSYDDAAGSTQVLTTPEPLSWPQWLLIGEELMGIDELGLGARLAALLGHRAGTDEATDGALLDEVGRLLRLHRGGE